jgi:hypothetical protein
MLVDAMSVGVLAAAVFAALWLVLAGLAALGWRAARILDRGDDPWTHGL